MTIVFTDDKAGEHYTVTDVKLNPTWRGQEYQATSVKATVKDCVSTKDFSTVSLDTVTSPDIAIIEGKLKADKV